MDKPAARAANPYIAGRALTVEDFQANRFIGRKAELELLLSRLRNRQSVAVVGERRIGKSSLLNYLCYVARTELEVKYECHYLDLEGIYSASEFYSHTCQKLGASGNDHLALDKALKAKGKKAKIVILCLDEFESTANDENFGPSFFKVLRSFAQVHPLALITATRNDLSEVLSKESYKTSKFENIFSTCQLGELTDEEANNLVKAFAEADQNKLKCLAGNHPYKLTRACMLLYEAQLEVHYKQNQSKVWKKIATDLNKKSTLYQRLWAARAAVITAMFGVFTGLLGISTTNRALVYFSLLLFFLVLLLITIEIYRVATNIGEYK